VSRARYLKIIPWLFFVGGVSACGPKGFSTQGRQYLPADLGESKVTDPGEDGSADENGELGTPEVTGSGLIKPTVYYFPVINEDQKTCNSKVPLLGPKGEVLAQVCQSSLSSCSLQGACALIQNNTTRSFNINGRVLGRDRFFETTNTQCKFGFGVKKSCLDPFYTLAADLTIYQPGDVIYIPRVAGLRLPNGSKHNGYFIIRDTGRAIKGHGRFDFFSGYYGWKNSENPFIKLGLGSKSTQLPFYKISGPTAKFILASRGFPLLPGAQPGAGAGAADSDTTFALRP